MLIGLVGFIGSGKGTIADILTKKHDFTKLSFADTLKDATAAIFGWQRHLLEGDTDESRAFREQKDEWWSERFGYEFTPRLALQWMGTEAGRQVFHEDIWLRSLERRMELYPNVVIADVRFRNEIEFIQSKGGFIVRVNRGGNPVWYDTALIANSTDEIPVNGLRTKKMQAWDDMETKFKVHYSEWAWIGTNADYQIDNIGNLSNLDGDVQHMLKVFTGPKHPATIAA